MINKFAGDAALAVFGAPLRMDEPASAALATARALATKLRQLPVVDFGVGVSAGRVFAGNIGAENRYEYTVIGDAVNEAARLADLAKTSESADPVLGGRYRSRRCGRARAWAESYSTVLRGRSEATPGLGARASCELLLATFSAAMTWVMMPAEAASPMGVAPRKMVTGLVSTAMMVTESPLMPREVSAM